MEMLRCFLLLAVIFQAVAGRRPQTGWPGRNSSNKDCVEEGLKHGENTDSGDDCNSCTCMNGVVMCTAIACRIPERRRPHYPKAIGYKDCVKAWMRHGERGDGDCSTCTCMNGVVVCSDTGSCDFRKFMRRRRDMFRKLYSE